VRRLFFGRAAGAASCFALGQNRNRGFVFEFPEKIVGDGFESLLSMALSLRLRPRSLSKIRIVASVDHGTDNADRDSAIFVADQTFCRTMLQVALRQRAPIGSI
jgi:hypothetical protein